MTEAEKTKIREEQARWQNFRREVQRVGWTEAVARLEAETKMTVTAKVTH